MMNTVFPMRFILLLALTVLFPACRTAPLPLAEDRLTAPRELLERTYLFEIVRHL